MFLQNLETLIVTKHNGSYREIYYKGCFLAVNQEKLFY